MSFVDDVIDLVRMALIALVWLMYAAVGAAVQAAITVLLFWLVLGMQVSAHEWYPPICCSVSDCAPMGEDAEAREPAPTFTRRGWRLHDGQIVPHSRARPSPDGRFHICRRGGRVDGELITPNGEPPCLWVPAGAT